MDEISHLRIPPRVDSLPLSERETAKQGKPSWRHEVQGDVFDFRQGRILLNGQDLGRHLQENLTHLGSDYWTTLGRRLGVYRDYITLTLDDPDGIGKLSALAHAFLAKIFGRMKRKFDETVDGISFHLEDGQLLLNGINVHAFLTMARRRRNEKARIFLKGLRNRLTILLENRSRNASYERIREVVERLAGDIDVELKNFSESVYQLPAPAASVPD